MTNANDRALEIIQEFQKNNYQHIEELKAICDSQLNMVIKCKQYNFFTDWDEDDFCSEVIGLVWEKRNEFDETRGSFFTWLGVLAKTVYNKCYKKMKKRLKTIPMYMPNEDGEEVNIVDTQIMTFSCETEVISKESCHRIWDKLDEIPENQRKAIQLCRIEGYKPAESADVMECNASDISRWLFRGVEKIEEYVRDEEFLTYIDISA